MNGNSAWGRIGVALEKFSMSWSDYMHSTNFINIDMMLADNPRLLTEEEKKTKKVDTIKVSNLKEERQQLEKMFDFD